MNRLALDMMKSPMSNGEMLFLTMFFSPLLGVSGFWYIFLTVYIISQFFRKPSKPTVWGVTFTFLYIAFLGIKFFQISSFSIWFTTAKFYMGWGVVTLFLYYSKISINVNRLILLFCYEIILEFVLINTVVPQSVLPNYPNLGYEIMTGSFKRVYSVGCNATTSATILVMLLGYREAIRKRGSLCFNSKHNRIIFMLSLLAIIAFGSGTGFILYLIYVFYKFNLFKIKYIAVLFTTLFAIITFFSYITIGDESIFQRLSGEYLEFLWEYKEWQVTDLISEYKVKNIYLGADFKYEENALIWGDFAFLEYYVSLGICGIFLFIMYVFYYLNRINYFPILIGVIGAFHYGGIFTFPGQLLFAYCVLINKQNYLSDAEHINNKFYIKSKILRYT